MNIGKLVPQKSWIDDSSIFQIFNSSIEGDITDMGGQELWEEVYDIKDAEIYNNILFTKLWI